MLVKLLEEKARPEPLGTHGGGELKKLKHPLDRIDRAWKPLPFDHQLLKGRSATAPGGVAERQCSLDVREISLALQVIGQEQLCLVPGPFARHVDGNGAVPMDW